jgi:hypothetical protein
MFNCGWRPDDGAPVAPCAPAYGLRARWPRFSLSRSGEALAPAGCARRVILLRGILNFTTNLMPTEMDLRRRRL